MVCSSKKAAFSAASRLDFPSSLSPATTVRPSPSVSSRTGPPRFLKLRTSSLGEPHERERRRHGSRATGGAAPAGRRRAPRGPRRALAREGHGRPAPGPDWRRAPAGRHRPAPGREPLSSSSRCRHSPWRRATRLSSASRSASPTTPMRLEPHDRPLRVDDGGEHVVERRGGPLPGAVERQALPAMAAHREPLHGGWRPRPSQLDQQRHARIVGSEAVGLGRAGVPGAGCNLEAAVPVAERQIVEPGAGPRAPDRSGSAPPRRRAGGPSPSRARGRCAATPAGVVASSIQAVRSSSERRSVKGAGSTTRRPSASGTGRGSSSGITFSGGPRANSRVQADAASAASWFPGRSSQGPAKPRMAASARLSVASLARFESKTSPATRTASTSCSRAEDAMRRTASKRASRRIAPASPGTLPNGLPSCQSAVWRSRALTRAPGDWRRRRHALTPRAKVSCLQGPSDRRPRCRPSPA